MTSLRSRSSRAELAEELRHFCRNTHAHAAILPERKLAEQYGLSHSTIRRVLAELLDEGLIYKVQGRGTFVAETPRSTLPTQGTIVYGDSWADPANRHRNQIVHGLSKTADRHNLRLEMKVVDIHLGDGKVFWDAIDRPEVRGLILPWLPPELYRRLRPRLPAFGVVTTASAQPPPGIAAVGVDYVDMGRQGAAAIALQAGERPAAVCRVEDAALGYRQGCQATGIEAHFIRGDHFTTPAVWAERLLAADPTAVFFDDDLRAGAILPLCEAARPGFIASCHIVSHANVGNDDLPPSTLRLELDGFTVGKLIVNVIHGIAAGDLPGQTSYRLRPTLVRPNG